MDKNKAISFIEESFLSTLLKDEDVTDISYNGKDIYYVSNSLGRKKSDIVIDQSNARDFIRQITNLCEGQFSFSNPNFDASIGRYRINATHQSIGRIADEGVITFSIRIASKEIRITNDSDFLNPPLVELIKVLLASRCSIVIGGVTSTGKTEFQKYLLQQMKENERVIVIDNVTELEQVRNDSIDLTCWKCNEDSLTSSPSVLVKNALRNNPDWLLLAEARGKEMVDVVLSAMTGLPIITTLHALDASAIPSRMARMMMKSEQKIDYSEALNDIYYHFHFYFYLSKKVVNGQIKRYIKEVNFVSNSGNVFLLYKKEKNKNIFSPLPKEAFSYLDEDSFTPGFKTIFVKGEKL